MAQQDDDLPRIEFPCHYQITILGRAAEDFTDTVIEIVERHAPGIDESSISMRDSRNGRFRSVKVTIWATGKTQLDAIHVELRATGRVHMVI